MKALCKATWDYTLCLFKPLQTACCAAFCSKCASIHCAEIHQSWIFPKHVTTPSHMTENHNQRAHRIQSQRHYHDSLGYAGSLPSLSPLIPASAHLCPRAAGWERWAGVTGTPSPIQRKKPRGKEERKIYTMSTSLLYVEIYNLAQTQSRFRTEDSPTFNRTVSLSTKQPGIFTGKSDVNEQKVIPWITPCRNLWLGL